MTRSPAIIPARSAWNHVPQFIALACVAAIMAACGAAPPASTALPTSAAPATAPDAETLTQVSTYPALQMGQFDGDVSFAQLAQAGDFGLGTFDNLEGEMIALDGVFYQAKADGSVGVADKTLETPFADVHFFHSSQQAQLNQAVHNLDELKAALAKLLPSPNRPYAFKISGTFPTLKLRSVPKQSPPYPTLADAVAKQVVFEQQNISGTMVGYALPAYLGSIGVAGYHFHFISTDKLHGGHVLDVSLNAAAVDIDYLENVKLMIPQNPTFQQTDFSKPQN